MSCGEIPPKNSGTVVRVKETASRVSNEAAAVAVVEEEEEEVLVAAMKEG